MSASSISRKEGEEWLANFPRLFDLYQHSHKDDPRNYFQFEELIPWAASNFTELEKLLSRLDAESWKRLCAKSLPYVTADDASRRYQQLFDHLNEARGYVFLADQGYNQIEFIEPKQNTKKGFQSPDLFATKSELRALLEVKTINESNENLGPNATWRKEAVTVRRELPTEFKNKLIFTIEQARFQLNNYPLASDRKIVFLIARLDHGMKTGCICMLN